MLGRHEEALDCGRKAMELVPESSDSWSGPGYASTVAALRARAGETDAAVREYARLLRNGGANVHQLRVAPLPATLRQDPRFQALLNEPKNNAPLF